MRVVWLLTCAFLGGGCSREGTGVLIKLLGTGSVNQIDVTGDWNGNSHRAGHSDALAPVALPTEILVMLPDASLTARFDVSASLGGVANGEGSTGDVSITPHNIANAAATLAPPGSDLSMLPDLTLLSDLPPPDLAQAPLPDLLGVDLNGADLKPLPDLMPACTGARCPYAYRRRITVANLSATLPIGYTVRVPLPTLTGKTRGDLNDLRIFEDSPNQERDRIVDTAPPGQSAAAWFALGAAINPASNDNGYWLYYGDPNAAAGPQTGSNVFAFYDDFPGTTLNARWTSNPASGPSVAGGLLTLHKNGSEAVHSDYVNDKVPVLSALEARFAVSDASSAGGAPSGNTYWYWFGYQRQNDFNPTDPWILWISRGANDVSAERSVNPGNCYPSACSSSTLTQNNAFHWYRIERLATSTAYFYDGVSATGTPFADTNTDDYSIMIRNFAVSSDLTVDWVRARALANPEPMVSVGAEEVLH